MVGCNHLWDHGVCPVQVGLSHDVAPSGVRCGDAVGGLRSIVFVEGVVKGMLDGSELSREDLLELAQLGALGMLDEVDAARLERALAAASPSLQAEIKALEQSTVTDPALFASEKPPASLRLRVLARLADEIEGDVRSAQPLATIGPATGGRAQRAEARDERGANVAAASEASMRDMRELIEDLSRRNAAHLGPRQLYWRAASFVLLASLLVSLYFNNRLSELSRRLADSTVARSVEEDVARLAHQFRGFDFASARHVDLVAARPSADGLPRGHVSIYEEQGTGRVAVLGIGFGPGEIVRVNILDAEGAVVQSSQFRVAVAGFGGIVDLGPEFGNAPLPGMRVEVVSPEGEVLFRQA